MGIDYSKNYVSDWDTVTYHIKKQLNAIDNELRSTFNPSNIIDFSNKILRNMGHQFGEGTLREVYEVHIENGHAYPSLHIIDGKLVVNEFDVNDMFDAKLPAQYE